MTRASGFDKADLLAYLKSQFGPMDCHFTYDMASNLLDYAETTFRDGGALAGFLASIIPQVRREELEPFCKATTTKEEPK